MTTLEFPKGVTSIGIGLFFGCTGLKKITIPDSVSTIEDLAFSGCKNFTQIFIPDSVIFIGSNAFNGCSDLTILYEGSQAQWDGITGSSDSDLQSVTKYYDCKYISDEIFITYSNEETTAYITPNEKFKDKTFAVAFYKDNRLIDIKADILGESQMEMSSSANHDEIKVMVWDDLTSGMPLREVECISTADWTS